MNPIDTIQAGYLIEFEELQQKNTKLKEEQKKLIEKIELLSKKEKP